MRSLEEADKEFEKNLKKELEKAKQNRREKYEKKRTMTLSDKPRGKVGELIDADENIPFY